jgi:methylmalonyl-CoA mutase N-terminal domain/subunit
LEERQRESVKRVREQRDEAAVQAALAALTEAARGDANLMYPIVEAARLYATEGEIVIALRDVFGGWRETPVF